MHVSPNQIQPCGGSGIPSLTLWSNNPLTQSFQWLNTTKVKDYASGSSGYIDPYGRPCQALAPDCSPFNAGGCPDNPCYHCGDGVNGNPFCEIPYPLNSDQRSCVSKSYYGPYSNCFSQSAYTTSFNKCVNSIGGFKNLYAKKAFHGRLSYTSPDWFMSDSFQWCCTCGISNPHTGSADDTHYLAISASAVQTQYSNGTLTATGTAQQTVHVDRYSGNLIVDSCSSGSSDEGTIASNDMFGLLGMANGSIGDLANQYCSLLTSISNAWGSPLSPVAGVNYVITQDGPNAWHLEWWVDCTKSDDSVVSLLRESLTVDLSAGTLQHQSWDLQPCSDCGTYQTGNTVYAYSGTSFQMTMEGHFSSSSCQQTNDTYTTVSGQLSNTYTSADVKADIIKLLKTWDLTDDNLYPIRTDLDVTIGPLVTYNEKVGIPQIGIDCSGSIDPGFDGSIIGKPLPKNFNHWWDQTHQNWNMNGCDSLVDPECHLPSYLSTYGAWSDSPIDKSGNPQGCHVPAATQWVNNWDAAQLPEGPFQAYNWWEWSTPSTCNSNGPSPLADNYMWVCEWVEQRIRRPSWNWARPCAGDRYLVMPQSASCILNFSQSTYSGTPINSTWGQLAQLWSAVKNFWGNPPAMQNTINLVSPGNFQNNDVVLVYDTGNSGVDGMWKVSVNSSTQLLFTPANLIISGSQIDPPPADAPMVAKVRFPNAPVICGRNYVVAQTGNNPVILSLEQPHYLVDGDKVYAQTGNSGLSYPISATVTLIDDYTVALNINTTATIQYLYSAGSPDWKWDNSTPLGTFTAIHGTLNNRGIGEYNRMITQQGTYNTSDVCDSSSFCPSLGPAPTLPQPVYFFSTCSQYCLPYTNPCATNVIYCSPMTRSFAAGAYVPFDNVILDSIYGTYWGCQIQAAMDDLLFEAPPGCQLPWMEDDGTCNSGQYPHRDQFEAICVKPVGSPALPAGAATIGCPTQQSCGLPPTGYGEGPYIIWAPWQLAINEAGCICEGGEFAEQYVNNLASCPNPNFEYGL